MNTIYEGTSGSLETQIETHQIEYISRGNERIVDTTQGFIKGRGKGRINLIGTSEHVRSNFNVVASVTELDAGGRPFVGHADLKVYNVAPFDGGVTVRIDVAYDRDLNYKVMLRWA